MFVWNTGKGGGGSVNVSSYSYRLAHAQQGLRSVVLGATSVSSSLAGFLRHRRCTTSFRPSTYPPTQTSGRWGRQRDGEDGGRAKNFLLLPITTYQLRRILHVPMQSGWMTSRSSLYNTPPLPPLTLSPFFPSYSLCMYAVLLGVYVSTRHLDRMGDTNPAVWEPVFFGHLRPSSASLPNFETQVSPFYSCVHTVCKYSCF